MSMQWRYRHAHGVAVVELTGYLGDAAIDQLGGAVGWAVAKSRGPILIDMSGLLGWSVHGREAVADAGVRLAADQRRLGLCGLSEIWPSGLSGADTDDDIEVYPDLDSAVAALATGAGVVEGPAGSETDGPDSIRPVGR
jgi:hypothetical protein